MTNNSFLDMAFDKIRTAFPEAVIEYEFKSFSKIHFIKVTPKFIYNSDAFVDIDFNLSDIFFELGLEGDLCFISEDSLTDIYPTKVNYPALPLFDLTTKENILLDISLNNITTISDNSLSGNGVLLVNDPIPHSTSFKLDDFNMETSLLKDLSEFEEYQKERLERQDKLNYRLLAMAA